MCVELIDEVGRGKSIALMTSGKDENSQQFRLKKTTYLHDSGTVFPFNGF